MLSGSYQRPVPLVNHFKFMSQWPYNVFRNVLNASASGIIKILKSVSN